MKIDQGPITSDLQLNRFSTPNNYGAMVEVATFGGIEPEGPDGECLESCLREKVSEACLFSRAVLVRQLPTTGKRCCCCCCCCCSPVHVFRDWHDLGSFHLLFFLASSAILSGSHRPRRCTAPALRPRGVAGVNRTDTAVRNRSNEADQRAHTQRLRADVQCHLQTLRHMPRPKALRHRCGQRIPPAQSFPRPCSHRGRLRRHHLQGRGRTRPPAKR